MKKTTSTITPLFTVLLALIFCASCDEKVMEQHHEKNLPDMASFEKEIETRLRDYEKYLRNGDSLALGNMYTEDAEIIPSTVGRANIIKVFGSMIRDSITGSSFKTTKLWGNDELLVEDGTGRWYHSNGTEVGKGRYLLVWQKEGSEWKILRDTWFPSKN